MAYKDLILLILLLTSTTRYPPFMYSNLTKSQSLPTNSTYTHTILANINNLRRVQDKRDNTVILHDLESVNIAFHFAANVKGRSLLIAMLLTLISIYLLQ